MRVSFLCLAVICVVSRSVADDTSRNKQTSTVDEGAKVRGPGAPLFLTPYIEKGRIKEGRKKAKVTSFTQQTVNSYAGYLTVDKIYNSNLFFWYFRSERDPNNDPTVIWLQGGPGSSSLFGLFVENGPYEIVSDSLVRKRHTAWSKISNLIYFDNPVGTGYSFTNNDSGYATNQTKVGKDLYEAIIQLFTLFPELKRNDLFVTGESYAGKYIPAIGHTIHRANELRINGHAHVHINLKGLMIGNGFTDPIHMMIYSKYLYEHGLIDDKTKNKFHKYELKTIKLMKQHKWRKASQMLEQLVGDESSLFYKYTGLTNYYNYYNLSSGDWKDYQQAFVTSDQFRRRVHVGNITYSDGVTVYKKLYNDQSKSVINWVAELLKHYRVLFYNGQLDVICAYPLTVSYLRNMKWNLSKAYKNANRHIYRLNGEVAGYYKTVGNLTEMLIRNAGHMVPTDQPIWSLYLLTDFIHNNIHHVNQ